MKQIWRQIQKVSLFRVARIASRQGRFELLRRIGRLLVPGYRFSLPQMAWWEDAAFNDFLGEIDELNGVACDRRWMLFQLLRLSSCVPGDTVECGVYKGAGSSLICRFAKQNGLDRRHHVFDSFAGLSKPGAKDGAYWGAGDMACDLEVVKARLAGYEGVEFHPGWIPTRWADVATLTFSFVHVDVDLYQPTLDCMTFFYPRLNPGGVLLCDDYGFTSCPGATEAVESFLEDKPERMLALASGGGFLIKGVEVRGGLDAASR